MFFCTHFLSLSIKSFQIIPRKNLGILVNLGYATHKSHRITARKVGYKYLVSILEPPKGKENPKQVRTFHSQSSLFSLKK